MNEVAFGRWKALLPGEAWPTRRYLTPWLTDNIDQPPELDGSSADTVKGAVVVIEHEARGESDVPNRCSLPLITDLAVFAVAKRGAEDALTLMELAPGVTVGEVCARTDADFSVALYK